MAENTSRFAHEEFSSEPYIVQHLTENICQTDEDLFVKKDRTVINRFGSPVRLQKMKEICAENLKNHEILPIVSKNELRCVARDENISSNWEIMNNIDHQVPRGAVCTPDSNSNHKWRLKPIGSIMFVTRDTKIPSELRKTGGGSHSTEIRGTSCSCGEANQLNTFQGDTTDVEIPLLRNLLGPIKQTASRLKEFSKYNGKTGEPSTCACCCPSNKSSLEQNNEEELSSWSCVLESFWICEDCGTRLNNQNAVSSKSSNILSKKFNKPCDDFNKNRRSSNVSENLSTKTCQTKCKDQNIMNPAMNYRQEKSEKRSVNADHSRKTSADYKKELFIRFANREPSNQPIKRIKDFHRQQPTPSQEDGCSTKIIWPEIQKRVATGEKPEVTERTSVITVSSTISVSSHRMMKLESKQGTTRVTESIMELSSISEFTQTVVENTVEKVDTLCPCGCGYFVDGDSVTCSCGCESSSDSLERPRKCSCTCGGKLESKRSVPVQLGRSTVALNKIKETVRKTQDYLSNVMDKVKQSAKHTVDTYCPPENRIDVSKTGKKLLVFAREEINLNKLKTLWHSTNQLTISVSRMNFQRSDIRDSCEIRTQCTEENEEINAECQNKCLNYNDLDQQAQQLQESIKIYKEENENLRKLIDECRCLNEKKENLLNDPPVRATPSGLTAAIEILQAKCRSKDAVIAAMASVLRGSQSLEQLARDLVSPCVQSVLDFDQCALYVYLRRLLVSMSLNPDQSTFREADSNTTININADSMIPIPTNFQVVREVCKCLLVAWKQPENISNITGYEVFIDGNVASHIRSPTRTETIVEYVDCAAPNKITLRAVGKNQRFSYPVTITYPNSGADK